MTGFNELLEACKTFLTLNYNCDMRPEDECYEIAAQIRETVALVDPDWKPELKDYDNI